MVKLTITVEATDLKVVNLAVLEVLGRIFRGEREGVSEYVSQCDDARSKAEFTVEETGPDNT
jgi:hypothetical protein